MRTPGIWLDRDTIARVDASDQLTDVLAIPEHMRDALWKFQSANLWQWDCPAGLVVAGMGGSAIGGRLAARRSATPPRGRSCRAGVRAAAVDDPRHDRAVLLSYSGDTEETLACYEAASALGARRGRDVSGGELAEMARGTASGRYRWQAGSSPAPRSHT